MKILIGHTGFVGSNLNSQYPFDAVYNSKNIKEAFGTAPDLCVYAGIRSEKFAADRFPAKDLEHIKEAISIIENIKPKKLVLISTVDVIPFSQSFDVYEDTPYTRDNLTPYGENRLFLEKEVHRLYPTALIIRLPALFGNGLKKNFIYDLITFVPAMLKKEKFDELYSKESEIINFYTQDQLGFYRINSRIKEDERLILKDVFKSLGFSALNFTDSRSKFSFYNLDYLWKHIEILQSCGATISHMANEPITASEIYEGLYGRSFINEISPKPFDYTFFKTKYAIDLNGSCGYIFTKKQVMEEITMFCMPTR